MSKHSFTTGAIIYTALAAFVVGGQVAQAGSASGGGQYIRPDQFNEGANVIEHIGFNARHTGEGLAANGQIQVSLLRQGKLDVISHMQVDCMLFLDDSTVIIGGTIVFDKDPDYIGTTAAVVVRDNGEGRNAPADERTTVYASLDVGIELDCETVAFLLETEFDLEDLLLPLDTGNYRVNP